MELYARVWYEDSPGSLPTGPFLLPDTVGADALILDIVGSGWYKAEIMDEYRNITHIVIRDGDSDDYNVVEMPQAGDILRENWPMVGNHDHLREAGRPQGQMPV